jgi:hypothetical protein
MAQNSATEQPAATKKRNPGGRPFTKGDPRINAGGRPKAVASAVLREMVTEQDLKEVWTTALAQAKQGDKDARRDIFDRLEGKPVQRNENSGPDGSPLEFEHKFEQLSDEQLLDVLKAAVAE